MGLSDSAKNFLAEKGYDPTFGARPLKRAFQRYIQDPLSLKLIEGEYQEGDTIVADIGKVYSRPESFVLKIYMLYLTKYLQYFIVKQLHNPKEIIKK